ITISSAIRCSKSYDVTTPTRARLTAPVRRDRLLRRRRPSALAAEHLQRRLPHTTGSTRYLDAFGVHAEVKVSLAPLLVPGWALRIPSLAPHPFCLSQPCRE